MSGNVLAICLLALTISEGRAQPNDIKFERISLEEGLSQSSISAILQDSRGFMWFGTLDGLNRYDGYGFSVFKYSPSDSTTLSASTISALYEDRFGYLWIGTMAAGLNRLHHDSGRIDHFKQDPLNSKSLNDNRVRTLLEDRDGVLWIGTRDGGLNQLTLAENLDPQTAEFRNFKHDPENRGSLSDNHVRALLEDPSGTLWIGTRNGLNRFDRQNQSFVRYAHDPGDLQSLASNNVECLYRDLSGNLWVGTLGGGLNLIRAQNLQNFDVLDFVHFKNDPGDPNSLSDNFVETVFEDRAGTLWVGTTNGGLNRLLEIDKTNAAKFVAYRHRLNDPTSIGHNNIEILFEDFSGILWVGTWGGGLSKINRKQKKFSHFKSDPENPNSLCNNSVRAFCEDERGGLWIGAAGGVVDRLDRRSGAVTHFHRNKAAGLGADDVRALTIDRDGDLWMGTYGSGVTRLSLKSYPPKTDVSHFRHNPANPKSMSDDFVWAICEDRRSNLWVGTNRGLNQFDPATREFQHFQNDPNDPASLSHDVVRAVFFDSRDRLWVGTYAGLNRLELSATDSIPPRDGISNGRFVFKRYYHSPDDPNSLSHNSVISIYEDDTGVLWFGTLGGGLNKLIENTNDGVTDNEKFIRYAEEDGLPNMLLHTILGDEHGNLWISTIRGLSRFNERLPAGARFRNFDVSDGLQSNEFNAGAALKARNGEMFFGGINGFNSFFPDDVKDNPNIAPVVLTAFKIFNQERKLERVDKEHKPVTLSYRDNFFAFEFAALDFTTPTKNQYAYKMDGFDLAWVYCGTRRFASYTNLDPGEYVFRVKGSNNDGVWNEEGTSIRIEIVPPFWQRWWFRVSMFAGLAAMVAAVFHNRMKKLRAEKRAQEIFARRLIEIQEGERKRIASELHDSLGQDMLIIKNRIQQCIPLMPEKSKAAGELSQLADMAMRSIDEVREISSNLHPHQLDRLGLKKAIEAMAAKFVQGSRVKVVMEIAEVDGVFPKEQAINIYRIVQETMNNIFKHADATEALIQIKRTRAFLSLLIKDNGRGFDAKAHFSQTDHAPGFGLSNIFERVKILGGRVKIESKPGEGTAIKIRIPI
jgi:ligand-binding sensor domain-containing protein/signal transduction histidine kinase